MWTRASYCVNNNCSRKQEGVASRSVRTSEFPYVRLTCPNNQCGLGAPRTRGISLAGVPVQNKPRNDVMNVSSTYKLAEVTARQLRAVLLSKVDLHVYQVHK